MAEGLTFQPDGTRGPTVLRDLSFRVPPAGSLLVAGPTGAGKSVLLRLIAGLAGHDPDPRAAGRLELVWPPAGGARVEGEPGNAQARPREQNPEGPRLPTPQPGRVVLVTQSPRDALVGLDVFSALAMPLEEQGLPPARTRRRVEDALDRFGLGALQWRDVAALSSGEARRVALAGALAQDAPLVLLDEPFADLDPTGARLLREDLRSMRGHRTMVVAEHRLGWFDDLADATLHLLVQQPRAAARGDRWFPLPGGMQHRPALAARGLTIRRGGRNVVEDADMELGPGVWGLIGPNGAGKTSLLMALAGLSAPAAGRVEVAGVPVWREGRRVRPVGRNERSLRRRLQVVFQEPREAFFAGSVLQELAAPLEVLLGLRDQPAQVRAREALEQSGCRDLGTRSPQRLSGGEARFVQTLGALLPAPGVLFLDEPTHGLDARLRVQLQDLLRGLGEQGRLVVVATHEPDLLPLDARWMFLDDRRLVTGDKAAPGAPGPAAAGFLAAPPARPAGARAEVMRP